MFSVFFFFFFFVKEVLCTPAFIWSKIQWNNNTEKYYYNSKWLISILIYFKNIYFSDGEAEFSTHTSHIPLEIIPYADLGIKKPIYK